MPQVEKQGLPIPAFFLPATFADNNRVLADKLPEIGRIAYFSIMSTRSLFLMYGAALFIIVWGLDLVSAVKFGSSSIKATLLNPFAITQLIYTGSTLLIGRIIFKKFYATRNYFRLIIGLLLLIAFFIAVRYTLEEILLPFFFGIRNYWKSTTFSYYVLDNIYYGLIQVGIGFFLSLFENQENIRRKQVLLLQENREAELKFLRSQVNPHFLFNTLNNIYSLVYEKSAKAPDAVLKLADLMRYVLYEKKEKVPLQKEWDYILNFVELQKLRFDYPVAIVTSSSANIGQYEIAPHLLIAFVENAFKHGDFRKGDTPLSIILSVADNEITFSVSNKTGAVNKDTMDGIGLENVKRRLELVYPGKHRLQVQQPDSRYEIVLQLTLNPVSEL